MRTICGNMEKDNKYWVKDEERIRVLCEKGWDNRVHFAKEYETARYRFIDSGEDEEGRLNRIWSKDLDEIKG